MRWLKESRNSRDLQSEMFSAMTHVVDLGFYDFEGLRNATQVIQVGRFSRNVRLQLRQAVLANKLSGLFIGTQTQIEIADLIHVSTQNANWKLRVRIVD